MKTSPDPILVLRVSITARTPHPFVVVLAAEEGDGRAQVARELARSFARSGLRTAFVACDHASTYHDDVYASDHAGGPEYVDYPVDHLRDVKGVELFTADLRSRFEAVVVSTADCNLAEVDVQVLGAAGCAVVTMREGRKLSIADTRLAQLLKSLQVAVHGIVPFVPVSAVRAVGDSLPTASIVAKEVAVAKPIPKSAVRT